MPHEKLDIQVLEVLGVLETIAIKAHDMQREEQCV